jgi:hypothetical protein
MTTDHENGLLQKVGGGAAIGAAGTFVFGFALFATMLSDYATGDPSPADAVAFLVDHQAALFVWNLVILIGFGVLLVPVVLALGQRLRADEPVLAQVATVFGVIWCGLVIAAGMIANLAVGTVADLHDVDPARAEPVWSALDTVENGLGGGNELVGGIWVVLVSVAALRSATLPRWLGRLGILAGTAGAATVVPALEPVGAIFGIGLIVWFTGTGIHLLRSRDATADRTVNPAPAYTP